METSNKWLIFDGKITPADQPVVPAVSRGLMYGDGVFDTLRTYKGKTFLLKDHLTRLHAGMRMLGMQVESELETEAIKEQLRKLLEKQHLTHNDAIIRLQVWRDGQRGYHPQGNSSTHYSITASTCPEDFALPKLATVDQRRIPSQSMPSSAKFTNGINYILAAQQAAEKGGDDALMQTIDGFISETTIANLFWIKGDMIFTPDKECDLIPGITRKVVLDIIEENGQWECQKGKYSLDHLLEADAVWICNSVREVLAVEKIDHHNFDIDHPAIDELQNRYTALRRTNAKLLR
ncbi:aminotransferase class IV [Fodinibius sp.]|uniref:aminotransferase class IV n=1 Tax=Fodinibius sp. TaxID=1872440 RepID=UPI002ACD847A|nr:aminotransferase class IV [Fodinibius sp.]MDZ7658824.1 aminotransferase class IV [Fodinibius sp.]